MRFSDKVVIITGAAGGIGLASAKRFGLEGGRVVLEVDPCMGVQILTGSEEPIGGWVSRGYHRKVPSTMLVARGRCRGSASFVCRVEIHRPH